MLGREMSAGYKLLTKCVLNNRAWSLCSGFATSKTAPKITPWTLTVRFSGQALMQSLRNADANKFGLRANHKQAAAGDIRKGAPRPRKSIASKENEAPLKANKAKLEGKPQPTVESSAPQAKPATFLPVPCPSESLTKKLSEVGDVDQESSLDCLLVSAYVKDIFSYLLHLEVSAAAVRQDFLLSPVKMEITPRMRAILLDWLVQVHQRFTLLPETLYLTYHIIDAYMSSEAGPAVPKDRYQLIGVASMMLASKYEEIYPPNVADFVYVTDNAYKASEVTSMECHILSQLGYFLGYPLPIQFLRRYSKVAGATPEVHEAAKYLSELARVDYTVAHLPPSALAAAAFCLARDLLPAASCEAEADKGWSATLEVYSGYSREQLAPLVRLVAGIAVKAGQSVKLTAIRKKYSGSSVSMVSTWPELCSTSAGLRSAAGISN